jgi:hypothetical protein
MSQYEDRLKDYIDVRQRIALFYAAHPEGRLVTGEVSLTREPDDVPRVMVQAFAYRSPDDGHPGVGHSWLVLPGTTPYTRGSEVENAETSAWGRAIAALGIGIDKSIASANEVANKEEPVTPASQNAKERAQLAKREVLGAYVEGDDLTGAQVKPVVDALDKRAGITNGDGSLIGTAELAKDFPDFLPKMSPDGSVLAFKLVSPAGGIKVIVHGDMADILSSLREGVIGQRVSVWGRIRDETFTPKGSKKEVTYQVLDLERVKGPEFILPAQEAETVPLFEGPLFDAGIGGIGSGTGEL